jgi:hypothetical protein
MRQTLPPPQSAKRIAAVAIDDRERSSRVKTALKHNGNVDISIRERCRVEPGRYRPGLPHP